MHRLGRTTALTRVLRVQRPYISHFRPPLSTNISRNYATSEPPRSSDRFDKLFPLLRPGLKEDDLAMMIAALISSTSNTIKLAKLEAEVPRCMEGFDKARLQKKVDHYLEHPPQDNLEALLAAAGPSSTPKKAAQKAVTSKGKVLPKGKTESPSIIFDPSWPIGSPFQELLTQLQLPEARQTVDSMEPEDLSSLRTLLGGVYTPAGDESVEALTQISQLLRDNGFTVRFTKRPRPPTSAADEDIIGELQALIDPDSAASADKSSSGNRSSFTQMSDLEMSKRAARDASFAPPPAPIVHENDPYPDLMTPDPLMDSRDVQEFPPTKENPFHNRVVIRNHSSIFHEALEEDGFDFASEDWKPTTTDETEEQLTSTENLPLSPEELRKLYKFPIFSRRITQQTGKGKIHRQFVLVIVGNGDGLVGYGQGKDTDHARAEAKAVAEAVRNMDWVERFEKRTVWTEMESKLGATRLILRPRPVGFGLRCNPNLHQVLKAAGIKDISAKVWGSRNPLNVIKAAFRMLQAGHAPLAMGDGLGGPGRKLNKGEGLRSKSDVERERGRKLISLRK